MFPVLCTLFPVLCTLFMVPAFFESLLTWLLVIDFFLLYFSVPWIYFLAGLLLGGLPFAGLLLDGLPFAGLVLGGLPLGGLVLDVLVLCTLVLILRQACPILYHLSCPVPFVYGSLHCNNEIVTLLNLTLFTYNFYPWLIVMCCLFGNALYEWNVAKTNSCAHLNAIG